MLSRKSVARVVAEFFGTGALALVVLVVSKSQIGLAYFIAIAAGLMIMLMTLLFQSASDAHFNPALTIGLWTARKIKTLQAVAYLIAQFAGAYGAFWLFRYFIDLQNLQTTWPNQGHFTARVMLAEAIGAFVFAVAWMAALRQKLDTGRFAVVAGAGFALGVLIASVAAAGFINPAVALAARSWGWGTYVLGPVVGVLVGVHFYDLIFGDSVLVKAVAKSAPKASAKPAAKKKK